MQPTINKNPPYKDIVLVEYLTKWRNRLKKGDVVVALNPWRPDELICKRITAVVSKGVLISDESVLISEGVLISEESVLISEVP
jgi:hypothetical protein